MRVIRSSYRGAAEWRAQRRALQEARRVEPDTDVAGLPPLEPAVVVNGPGDHAEGGGVLVEAVGPDGVAIYARHIPRDGHTTARQENAIEGAIQEAWRLLVRHVDPPSGDGEPESLHIALSHRSHTV